jgi:FtsH-binding integral membrane protein
MTSLSEKEKSWMDSRLKRLDNYMLLKVGLLAIASVFGLADFAAATTAVRWLYGACWLVFVFYVYLLYDTQKLTAKLRKLLKNGRP